MASQSFENLQYSIYEMAVEISTYWACASIIYVSVCKINTDD
jgi:hypothetical protein